MKEVYFTAWLFSKPQVLRWPVARAPLNLAPFRPGPLRGCSTIVLVLVLVLVLVVVLVIDSTIQGRGPLR
jgi:hypothetical protein